MSEEKKTARGLWQDYAFLTREIAKFIDKHDIDLVLELIVQREKMQLLIEAAPDNGYKATPEGHETLQTIHNQNQMITANLRRLQNNAQRSHQISKAYDMMTNVHSGSFMDRKS